MSDLFSSADAHKAWARMRVKRQCPTLGRLRQGGAAVTKHLKNCDHCRARYHDMLNAIDYSDLFSAVQASEKSTPKSGQIRKILEKAGKYPLENWEDELFAPPMVVIIKDADPSFDFVYVAQIHDEPALADAGDIPLEMPGGSRYAESWNTYPMLPEFLGPVLFTVPREVVRQILTEEEKPLPQVDEESPVEAFRELEIEVGYHYDQLSIAKSLAKMENANTGKSGQPRISNMDELHRDILPISDETYKKQDAAKIIPFEAYSDKGKNRQERTSKSTSFIRAWKPLAVAACLVLMIGTIFLNRLIPSGEDNFIPSKQENTAAPRFPSHASQSKNSASLTFSVPSLISALQLYLASGGEATRGEEASHLFVWEKWETIKDIPDKWQAFAAGQWTARSDLGQTEPPFPKEWIPNGQNVAYWHDNPYFILGITAYVADLACRSDSAPTRQLADALSNAASDLEKILSNDSGETAQFIKSLRQKPLSCRLIQEKLDDLDTISPLF